MLEIWDLYDARRNATGETIQRGQTLPEGRYHLVVHGWVINSKNEILMTQRHPEKPFPMLWECTGGSAIAGESSGVAVLRELREEIGVSFSLLDGRRLQSIRREDAFVDVWVFRGDLEINKLVLQQEEVVAAKWVTPEIFRDMFQQQRVVPSLYYFPSLYQRVMRGGI